MKILITVEFYRAHGGGGIGEQAKQIAEYLASCGHDVTVATGHVPGRPDTINGVSVNGFAAWGNTIEGMGGDISRYREFLLAFDCDVMINFAANVWTTDVAFGVADRIRAKKILSTPGLSMLHPMPLTAYYRSGSFLSFMRNAARSAYKNIRRIVKKKQVGGIGQSDSYAAYYRGAYLKALGSYDRIVYTSAAYQDKLFGDENGFGAKAVIIPNGSSEREFSAPDEWHIREKLKLGSKRLLITVSNHYLAKGHGFVIDAFKKMNRRDAELLIIGQIPSGRGLRAFGHVFVGCYADCALQSVLHPSIHVLDGSDRAMVLSAYKNADVFLLGSELECAPLVMYESFAAKTLFITRQVGNVQDHRDVVKIVSTPEEMAVVANEYLDDEPARSAVTTRAFSQWQEHYTWNKVGEAYDGLVNSL